MNNKARGDEGWWGQEVKGVGDKGSLPGCFQAATRSHGPVEAAREMADLLQNGSLRAERLRAANMKTRLNHRGCEREREGRGVGS